MADLSKVTLPDSTTVNIKDSTARQAIDDAVTMTFATVATSGSYNDLSNKPTIPTVTLNGTSTTSPSFYAPTGAGTSGQVLTSNGSGAPTWQTPQSGGSSPWEDGSGSYSAQISDGGADASGDYSVAEGSGLSEEDAYDIFGDQEAMAGPTASGYASHAEGVTTTASGFAAHAEGAQSVASGLCSHAENGATASSNYSHAEGVSTASASYSHAEGGWCAASGYASHAEGVNTIAQNHAEHASGKFNSSTKTNTTFGNAGNTHFSIGIGAQNAQRANALEIMQNGDMYVKGVGSYTGTYASSGIKSLQTVLSEKVGTEDVQEVIGLDIDSAPTANSTNLVTSGGVKTALDAKQATLESGTNIKTINNESILGSGNITITGGSGSGVTDVRLSDGSSIVSSGIANLPIPSVSSIDNGKVFGVDSGVWSLVTPATGVTDVTVGGTSVVSNGTAAVPAIPTVPTISTDISADANSDVKTASPKAVKTYVDSHSGGVTGVVLPDGTNLVSNGIATIPNELPSVSSSDNGKVLMVVSGAWAAATLTTQTYYTGQSTPSSSLGNNGDLYLQIDES